MKCVWYTVAGYGRELWPGIVYGIPIVAWYGNYRPQAPVAGMRCPASLPAWLLTPLPAKAKMKSVNLGQVKFLHGQVFLMVAPLLVRQ